MRKGKRSCLQEVVARHIHGGFPDRAAKSMTRPQVQSCKLKRTLRLDIYSSRVLCVHALTCRSFYLRLGARICSALHALVASTYADFE